MRCCSRRDISRAFSARSSSTNGWDRSWCIESEKCQFVVGIAKTVLPSDAQHGRQRTIMEARSCFGSRARSAPASHPCGHVPSRRGTCRRETVCDRRRMLSLEKVSALRIVDDRGESVQVSLHRKQEGPKDDGSSVARNRLSGRAIREPRNLVGLLVWRTVQGHYSFVSAICAAWARTWHRLGTDSSQADWCARRDSNPRPLPSEGSTLSS